MNAGRERRALGLLLIVAAVIAALAAGAVRQRTAGTAVAEPVVPAPAAGSCLSNVTTRDAVVVRCDEVHTAEVLTARQVWRPEPGEPCRTVFSTSIIATGADWAPPPDVARSTGELRGGGERVGWIACVQRPVAGLHDPGPLHYRGRLTDPGGATAVVGTCFDDLAARIGCSLLHRSERVGIFRAETGERRPVTSCSRYAGTVVGSPDAFSGSPALVALATDVPFAEQQNGMLPRSGADVPASSPELSCEVRAPAGRALTGSVVGLGLAPLPLR